MKKGLIFNIQRYSVHDGSGIRTLVFLKGCPLFCPWCCNPESQGGVMQTLWNKDGKEELIGRWITRDELLTEIEKDEIFYRTSGGGVTFSGGEPLMQADFIQECLVELNILGIHTAIETTGGVHFKQLKKLLPFLDMVLFDLKIMNSDDSKQNTGGNIKFIEENFRQALEADVELIPRIPLIPGFTSTEENIKAIILFLKKYKINKIHLLPFHQYGSQKYDYLKWGYELKDVETLSEQEIEKIREQFDKNEIHTLLDGLE